MLKRSAEAWLLTDRTKLTERVSDVLCDFSSLHGVISDFPFEENVKQCYKNTKFLSLDIS